jgi:hypothetical protein
MNIHLSEFDSYENPKEGKTYISPPIDSKFVDDQTIRIVTRGIDSDESYEMARLRLKMKYSCVKLPEEKI